MTKIARYFVADALPEGASLFGGIPHRDITEEEFDRMPEWQQRQLDASPAFRKSKPRAAGEGKDEGET